MNQPTSEAASRSKVYRVIVGANRMDAAVYSPFSLLHSDDDDDALSCGLYHYILYNSQCYQTSSLLFVKNMSFGWSWRLEVGGWNWRYTGILGHGLNTGTESQSNRLTHRRN